MEEFDALMIRVNNLYYGRGKIVMSPEFSRVKEQSLNDSFDEEQNGNQATTAELNENPQLASKSSSQVLVVDKIVNLGNEIQSCNSQAYESNDFLLKNSPIGNQSEIRLNGGLSDLNSKQAITGDSRPWNNEDGQKSCIFNQGWSSENEMPRLVSGIAGELHKKEDSRSLDTGDMASQHLKASDRKGREIKCKLVDNPWLNGKISTDSANERKVKDFVDAPLIFKDKLKKWKDNNDLKVNEKGSWETLKRRKQESGCREFGVKLQDSEYGWTRKDPADEKHVRLSKRSYGKPLEEGYKQAKPILKETGSHFGSSGYKPKEMTTFEEDHSRIISRAQECCLPNSKVYGKSKSQGDLATLRESDWRNKVADGRFEEIACYMMRGGCHRAEPKRPLNLIPAKSMHDLIGKFENAEENDKEASPRKDLFGCSIEDGCFTDSDRNLTKVHNYYSKTKEIVLPDEKTVFNKWQAIDEATGVSKTHRIEFGSKGIINCLENNGKHRESRILQQQQPESDKPRKLKSRCKSSSEASAGTLGQGMRYASNALFEQNGFSRSEKSLQPELSADVLFLEYDPRGSTLSLNSMNEKGFTDRIFGRKCQSMCDLSDDTVKKCTHSFYRERFEQAISQSRGDYPSFDKSLMHWKSLQELKEIFERNSNLETDNCSLEVEERVQQAIIDGMTKYAEQKFGRKRAAPKGGKGRSAMDDYEIYMRSLRSKVKTSQDKLNLVLKQKKEVEEKVRKAEAEVEKQEKTVREAEDEKRLAEQEGRDPKLPSGFIVPQTAKKAVAGAGFANLVMKASAQLWEDKFMAMRAKKGGNEGQPEWMAKSKRSDKILVNVGKKGGHKKEEEHKPAWGSNLKKAEPRRKTEPKHDDSSKGPAFASVSLRKTGRKVEEEETGSKKVDWKEMDQKTSAGGSRRRRGGDDSD